MLGLTLAKITALLISNGYFILLPFSIVEGPIVAVIVGFLVSIKIFNFYISFTILLLGDVIGDIIFYYLGMAGRHSFINKWGKYVGISEEKIKKITPHFHNNTWKILLFSKTHPLGSAVLFTAGVVKMPFKKYIFINTLASSVKVIIFIYVGIYLGEAYASSQKYLNYVGIISTIFAILLVIAYFVMKRYIGKYNKDLTS